MHKYAITSATPPALISKTTISMCKTLQTNNWNHNNTVADTAPSQVYCCLIVSKNHTVRSRIQRDTDYLYTVVRKTADAHDVCSV